MMIDNKELTQMVKGTPPLLNFKWERMEKGLEKYREILYAPYLRHPIFSLLTLEESTINIRRRCFWDLSPFWALFGVTP